MQMADVVRCGGFPCGDVRRSGAEPTSIDVETDDVRIVLISECAAADPADDYYADGDPLFARTTVQAFRDAGEDVATIADVRALGVVLTTAVKCAKTAYGIAPATVKECSRLLERELD